MRRLARLAAALAIIACSTIVISQPASAGVIVEGGGSTWSQNAVDQWRADVAKFGLRINYQGVGSTAGREFFRINQVDFAVSEIPFQNVGAAREIDQLNAQGIKWNYLPIVAGGTSLMYNLEDEGGQAITNLRLSPDTIARIFTGGITSWNDAAIRGDNPGLALPSSQITPVLRADGSGTSAQFSAYLAAVAPNVWGPFSSANGLNPPNFTSNWPAFPGAESKPGSDGVANFIHNEASGQGTIGYVEASYAIERGRPVVAVRNQSGNFTLPTSENVTTALTQARINPDRTQELSNVYTHGDPNAYPISSYSYMIVRTAGPRTEADRGAVVARFVYYFACTGQAKAAELGYAPMPPNLQQIALDAAKEVPGAPAPPTIEDCVQSAATGENVGSVAETTGAPAGSGNTTSNSGDANDEQALGGDDPGAFEEDASSSDVAGAPESVRLTGGDSPLLPLLLAAIGLVVIVVTPAVVAAISAGNRSA